MMVLENQENVWNLKNKHIKIKNLRCYDAKEIIMPRKIINRSLAVKTDSYKPSHWLQFPPDTEEMFYYIEPRVEKQVISVFGQQELVMKHFMEVPSMNDIEYAKEFWNDHGEPFNYEGWKYINKLGYLPLEIRSVPEGTIMPSQNIITSFRSTDKNCFWLPGWCETLAMQLWYPTTASTIALEFKKVLYKWLEKTGTIETLPFKVHDFGYRGATCNEAAGVYGLGFLVHFMGTDNAAAILDGREFYNTNAMLGFSIPAAEHSTIISWGREGEEAAYDNILNNFAKAGKYVAVVSDSYDLSNAVRNIWCGSLKQKVLDSGCTLVVRPDSGDPEEVVLRTVQELEEGFGINTIKGYKVLPMAVRIIQGDDISRAADSYKILSMLASKGYSTDNLAFGVGAGVAQKYNRDTLKFAEKNSAIKRSGVWYDVCKSPKDAPWKASKAGQLDLSIDFKTVNIRDYNGPSAMRTIFRNGELLVDESFETIRKRSDMYFDIIYKNQ